MHAQAYLQLDTAELVAVCDAKRSGSTRSPSSTAAAPTPVLDDLLADKNVQLISVATPHKSHAALAIRCMRAGKHVIVEKPLTVELAEADQMIAVSRETGMTLGSVFQRRYWPAALKTKADHRRRQDRQAAPRDRAGQLSALQSLLRSRSLARSWEHEGGGVLTNQGIHTIDMFQWFMGATR